MFRRFNVSALAFTLVATLAACGSDSPSADTASTEPAAAAGASDAIPAADAALNEADVKFAQGMIAHHEQAVEMSEIALDPNRQAGAEVIDLATRIQGAQEPEIEQMTAWLTAAGEPITMDMSEGHDMSSMEGMMTAEQMDALGVATGTEFDTMWLEMMIAHHEGAISQSETVKANGANPDVLTLADQIINAQQGEIAEMKALVAG